MQHRSVRLTDQSAEAFDRYCTRKRVTLTALVESLGQLLAEGDDWVPDAAVERAGEIDSDRRSRR